MYRLTFFYENKIPFIFIFRAFSGAFNWVTGIDETFLWIVL